jgi:hypothetical protein
LRAFHLSVLAANYFKKAQVAQLVEQRTENPRVGGSNPPLGTKIRHFSGSLDTSIPPARKRGSAGSSHLRF